MATRRPASWDAADGGGAAGLDEEQGGRTGSRRGGGGGQDRWLAWRGRGAGPAAAGVSKP